jgi:hypothetical protein
MSTITTPTAPSGSRSTFGAIANRDGQQRVLQIPPLPGRREKVVKEAAATLVRKYADEVREAEDTIKKFGLTIEVSRLRDRLARSAVTDLQRLLLSTAGVPELLFNEAIAQQLEEEEKAGNPVRDTSVLSVGEQIQLASKALEQSLSAINESTQKFRESTTEIVTSLEKVAAVIDELDDGDVVGGSPTGTDVKSTGQSGSGAKTARGARTPKGVSTTRTSSTAQQTGKSTS